MTAYGRGDQAAFKQLVSKYWRPVFTFLRRMVHTNEAAEDVLAETFLKLHRSAPDYRPTARFSTFLYTIAYREAISVIRSQNRRGRVLVEGGGEGDASEWGVSTQTPEGQVGNRELLAKVDMALENLPVAQKAAFLMFYRHGASIQEISEVLELQPGSVRAYLTHARSALRRQLGEPQEGGE